VLNPLQRRDVAALAAEYEAHRGALEAAAQRLGFARADVEDLTQSVWVTFLRVVPRFEGRSQVRTFLLGILRREARRARDKAGRASSVDPAQVEQREVARSGELGAGELARAVDACVGELRAKERRAVELKLLEERETSAVSRQLGISSNYLGVLLHRARAHLRHCLAEHLA
jgi:RNA polymerase sigma factor (sigma-70 family)